MFWSAVGRRVLIETRQRTSFGRFQPLNLLVRSRFYAAMTDDISSPVQRGSLTMKPPNVLVFGQDSSEWKLRIESVINTDLYLVYTTTEEELQSPVWVENCRLLWLTKVKPETWSDQLNAHLRRYIGAGGTVVVEDSAVLNADALSNRAIHIDGNENSTLRAGLQRLGVLCDQINETISKTEGYLVTDKRVDSFFNGNLPEAEFRISNDDCSVTEKFTPIRVARPDRSKFNTEEYFQYLRTREIGRTLLYTEHVSTTMTTIRTIDSVHGAVAVATRQIRAVARGRNSWISPRGCAMYSTVLHFSKADRIAKRMSFLQHLAALSVVRAIRDVYPSLAVGIKWPNDVYYRREAKIAGILSTCTVKSASDYYCYLGCGVNISNSKPLTCVNNLAGSRELTVERFIAAKLTQLERLLDLYEKDPSKVLEEYHANWLHTGEEVTVEAANSRAIVRSVDEDGFLLAEKPDGEMLRLQPDGNSFDLMKGLITVKKTQ